MTPISELTNSQPTDLQGLSEELETVMGGIKSLQINQEASVQSLQRTYKEHGAVMIEQLHGNLNTNIDKCCNSSVGTSNKNLKEEMCWSVLSILNEFDNITVKELNKMKDEVISIKGSITSSIHKCTSLHNDLLQLLEIVQKIGDNKELCLIASIKCKHIIQQALTLLGKSGKVFKVQGKSEYNVRIPSDSVTCDISGICVLPDGKVLVVDWTNKNVKLLNQQYQVVSHLDVNAWPFDICLIAPSEVAVTVNASNIHEVQFITVNQGKLVPGRKFQLQHECRGIAHQNGDLFVTSGKELCKYTLNGKLICRLYEALGKNHDPALGVPTGLHVTPAGQVLVCGHLSHTVLQWLLSLDNDAKDVVDKDDLTTQKQLLSTEDKGVVKGSVKSKSSDVRVTQPLHVLVLQHEGHCS
ncbi:uncharacterized protein LOC127831123 [Dreissena polymorpha]|uniref:uncharacterized protein LOC127831123 n=1 Tax=Dreissena polymorpha TaxID=45954 RepID=UPI002264F28F|nr:uncharacterized protein LOC127831123 [Dreissena polymorpha]